jgi:hypothetical protein
MNVASEMGGAFMHPPKCDSEGNLYIRKYASDRPLLAPVVKIDTDGKRTALFDAASFSRLAFDRADAFSPESDGGLYQIAQVGVMQPRIYVLRFSADGTPSAPTLLDADLHVQTFAAFTDGSFLVSGVKRDLRNKSDAGSSFTAVFLADGRELAQLTFPDPKIDQPPAKAASKAGAEDATRVHPVLNLAEAEVGGDGNLYVMRPGSPVLVYVISSNGKIMKTLKVTNPLEGSLPSAFHMSANRLAISFWDNRTEAQAVVVADAQTGEKIATYGAAAELGPSFACYSANEGVFTYVKLGEGNSLLVLRAEAQ